MGVRHKRRKKDAYELEWLKAGIGRKVEFEWKARNRNESVDREGLANLVHTKRGFNIDSKEMFWLKDINLKEELMKDRTFVLGDIFGKRKRKR